MSNSPIAGLAPSFDEILARHEREIMRYLLRTTRDREDALDLFQETWLRAYRAYPTLESTDGVRSWLYRIATNLCLNRSRDRARRSRLIADGELGDAHDRSIADGSPDELIDLKRLIDDLPRQQRAAVIMRKFGGLEYEEIGAAMACSAETVRAHVYQAMKKIRAME